MTATCNGDMIALRPTESCGQYAAAPGPSQAGKRRARAAAIAALACAGVLFGGCAAPRPGELWPPNGLASDAAGAVGDMIVPTGPRPADQPVRCRPTLGDVDCHRDDGDLTDVYPVIVPMHVN